ncbi:coiled-coil domain-containing protein 66 isoform X9 [Ursus arctos]|uniref:coiled-coil domain-containing protein 66 isoform X9 n=1 Tax=Ursus arctos TaxID=9644 RepID=UPI002017FDC0|nr:coiled-coil domain-containing protein 66 isoform X9 [Ursus arctos]
MNLGDGLKLETELLDGKTKLILSPYECKSKNSVKMGNKTKIAKCPLRTKQTGYILKSTQNTCIRSGKLLQKKRMGSETSLAKGQGSLHLNSISNQPEDENVMGVFQKTEALSSVLDENKSVLNKNQETSKQYEQKIAIENVWKPADIFSTLGERERDRSLLEAKKAQWKKELDEQVALKKKEKEASEKWSNPWKKFESDKIIWENFQILDQSKTYASSSSILSQSPSQITVVQADGHPLPRASQILEEALPPERPFSALKQEQQRKWIEDLNKQIEDDRQRKIEGKITSSKELADLRSVYTPTTGSQVEPSEEEHIAKPVRDITTANSQKTNFLRSMTALLDPAQIEERDRRRQKQLEHQKAITAQVEEKRRKKQLEEQQRKKEEEEEERRLARDREEMQKQYEQDILKQKQKEEIMTLKTNELFQTMQRAQELAQRLKQEQRIRELAQKGHDTSGLIKNLGGHGLDDVSGKKNTCTNSATSPKKDTAVQTDDLNTGTFTSAESCCGTVIEREILNCSSPAEFNEQFNTKKDKEELINQVKGANLEKENSWYNDQCNEFARTEKTHMKKCPKRPDWNINKPLKRYIPASEKYPKQLQKQREEKKVRRQMELLNLVERNNPGHLCQNRGTSPVLPSCQETEPRFRWHLIKKEEEPLKSNAFGKERSQSPPVPVVKNRTQQTQTLKNSNYERENLILEGSQTETSPGPSEPSHFIPYVRTNEIYYLDPDAPLSRPLTQDLQYQNPHDCDQEQRQLFDSDVRDPLLNPNLVKNRDRQQAILKGLSELRQVGAFSPSVNVTFLHMANRGLCIGKANLKAYLVT